VLHGMEIESEGRVAVAHLSQRLLTDAGATHDDAEGLINIPLSVKDIQAAVFFKEIATGRYRISLRSKGDVDVNRVAGTFGGGGHRNAAGCTLHGPYPDVRAKLLEVLWHSLTAS